MPCSEVLGVVETKLKRASWLSYVILSSLSTRPIHANDRMRIPRHTCTFSPMHHVKHTTRLLNHLGTVTNVATKIVTILCPGPRLSVYSYASGRFTGCTQIQYVV
ncbi:hypothetical protein AB1N83_012608 [Pleurotus pulmonarius]